MVKARFAVVIVAAVTQRVDVPDEAGGSVLLAVVIHKLEGLPRPQFTIASAQIQE